MQKNIYTLVADATKHLSALNYTKNSCIEYLRIWKRFECFCTNSGQTVPSRETGNLFLEQIVYPSKVNPSYKRHQKRIVTCLFDLAEKGSFPLATQQCRIKLPGCHNAIYKEYAQHIESFGKLRPRTISCKLNHLKKFLNYLETRNVVEIDELKVQDIHSYISSSFFYAAVSSRTGGLYFLREFLNFLVNAHSLDSSLGKLFPVILSNRDAVLPSVYDAQELSEIINAQNNHSPCAKRNRAIVTLSVQIGMRVGDIKNLCINHIDWQNRRLSFTQQKTAQHICLPLPEESMYAILDYLKNERPESDSPYLFVKNRAPYGHYSDCNRFYRVVADCFKRAGIDTQGKHHGPHSLRHSVAVNMLTSDTPYPVVSGILGHTSANTTKTYLKVDSEQLRQLSLEAPDEN